MISRALTHVKQQSIGFAALVVALGGTSAAAINATILKNNSITPVKFNHQFINGTVRAWAVVASNGTVQASAGRPSVHVVKGVPNSYVITWKVAPPTQRGCFAMGGLTGENGGQGSAEAGLNAPSPRNWRVGVQTYGPQGLPLAQYFYTALIC